MRRVPLNRLFRITAEILAPSFPNFSLSISGQTHEYIIYAMRQQAKVRLSCVCIVIDDEFRHKFVNPLGYRLGSKATLTMLQQNS